MRRPKISTQWAHTLRDARARIIGIVSVALLAVFVVTPAFAALLAYEGFDYTAGALGSANGGSGWGTAWYNTEGNPLSGPADVNVTSGSLTSVASPFTTLVRLDIPRVRAEEYESVQFTKQPLATEACLRGLCISTAVS